MTRSRTFALVVGLLAAGAGSWALYYTNQLGAASALRLGGGLCAGVVLLAVLPATWPQTREGTARSPLEEALDAPPPARPEQPRSLRELEFAVRLASSRDGAHDVYYRLRPRLRELAEHRLRNHRLVDLDRDESAARELLGEELWQLLRAGAPSPEDRSGRGAPASTQARWAEKLESL